MQRKNVDLPQPEGPMKEVMVVFGDVEVKPRQRMKVTVPKVEILAVMAACSSVGAD